MIGDTFFLPNITDGEDKASFLKNRIRKNYRHIKKWAKKTSTNCFRIYDHEVPGFPLAIDYYDKRFYVQYFSKDKEKPEPSEELFKEIVNALISLFNTTEDLIYFRTRMKREKLEQYEKLATTKEFFSVLEYGIKFKINLCDYLDTGLFLDHRETRRIVASFASGKALLNLFAYTCSFSIHAAVSGAVFTKSVDLSNTYTKWGRDNFVLNELPLKNNPIIRADCLKFLNEELLTKTTYDLIIIDPPTISRSKKMEQFFDVQKDYIFLIEKSLKLLKPGGIIFFSTNLRSFSFDTSLFPHCQILDISKKTLPIDFHNEKIHKCYQISLH